MNQLSKILLSLIIFLMLNGCATIYVATTTNQGVQHHVRKSMVENEKRMRKERIFINKGHKQQRKEIERSQNKSWK